MAEKEKCKRFGIAYLVLHIVLLSACATGRDARGVVSLDRAIQMAARDIESNVPLGSTVALLNFSSPTEEFSSYVLEELSSMLVRGRKVIVVDREELDIIRRELDFQMSGNVSDESARAIGQMLGADFVLTGSLQELEDTYRFRIRVLEVESAIVKSAMATDINANENLVRFLLKRASGYHESANITSGIENNTTTAISTTTITSVDYSRAGIYVNDIYREAMNLNDALLWIKRNFENNGNYIIVLNQHERLSDGMLAYNNMNVNITLKTSGVQRIIWFNSVNPSSPLFTVGRGVTFTIEDGVTLSGDEVESVNAKNLVRVTGGTFVMNGGSLLYNKTTAVYVESDSIFIMNNGTISENSSTIRSGVGGVHVVGSGNFTMNSGTISGNTASGSDSVAGGVRASNFTMNNGTISGNNSSGYRSSYDGFYSVNAGGVYADNFIMNNGTISGNTADTVGGVYAGNFTMHNGTISENIGRRGYQHGYATRIINGSVNTIGGVYAGNFTMHGGAVSKNTERGVYAAGFTLYEGSISENTRGGVYVGGGNFTMHGGTVSRNTTDRDGGGVYVVGGNFTMYGGTVSENTAGGYGGGVFVTGIWEIATGGSPGNRDRLFGGNFTMNSGTISGNTADTGGGVYIVRLGGTFIKSDSGGVIYGSDAPEGQANRANNVKGHAVAVLGSSLTLRNRTAQRTDSLDSRNRIE